MMRVFSKTKRLFVGSLIILTAFAFPAHAFENVKPGVEPNPSFKPDGGNVMSLQGPKGETGEKGDSANPWEGGEVTGDVTFNEKGTFKKWVGIGAPVSETGSVFGVSLAAGKGVRIGNWGLDGGSALFVTPATASQEVVVIRGLAGQTKDIFRAETSDGSKQLVFKANGNVGIGTPNPVTRLDVNGGANVQGSVTAEKYCFGTDCKSSWGSIGGTPTLQEVTDKGAVTNKGLQTPSISGGSSTGKLTLANTSQDNGAFIELHGKDFETDATRRGELTLGTYGTSGRHQFLNYNGATWNPLMSVYPSGRVGIGTGYDEPQAKLEVDGRVLSRGMISVNERWTPTQQELNINSNQIWKGDTPGDDDPNLYLQYSRNGGGVVIGGASGATNAFNVQGWAKVRDRLGVGRDANDLQLEVANAIEIETEDQDNILRFHDPNDRWVSMGLDRSDGNKFKINEGGSVGTVNHFVMDGSGNVGIGKDVNATYRLDVAGKANAGELCLGGDCKSSWSQVAPAAQQPIAGAADGTIDWPNDISGISGSDIADKQITWDEVKNKPSTFPGSSVDWSAISNKPTNLATTDTTVPKAGGTFTGNVVVNQALQVNGSLNVNGGVVVGRPIQYINAVMEIDSGDCESCAGAHFSWEKTCPAGTMFVGLRQRREGSLTHLDLICQ